MTQFVCKVGTASGDIVEMTFRAQNESALRRELADKGYHLFRLKRSIGLSTLLPTSPLGRDRVRMGDFVVFNQELAALLRAGLPLLQSLDIMLERMQNPAFRRALLDIREKIKSGVALSDAFRSHGDLFPRIYSATLVAGEKSGNLEPVIRRYVSYQKLAEASKKKVIAAMVYPAFLFAFMISAVGYLLLGVIPKFADFFAVFNAELPPLTVFLLGIAGFLRDHIFLVVLGLGAAVVLFIGWLQRPGSKALVDRGLLRIPVMGTVFHLLATSQLCRSLSTLLAGGMPLVQAIDIAAQSIGNRFLGEKVGPVSEKVREGKSFASSLEATGYVSNLTVELAKVGESTGSLAEMMSNVADFCDEEVENRLEILLSMLTPIVLLLMGGLVAIMILAIYMPLFELASVSRAS
jgi:type IV pilus assembly protein PilC